MTSASRITTRPTQPRWRARNAIPHLPSASSDERKVYRGGRSISVARLVDELVLPDPGHHRAQLLADDFDRVLCGHPAARHQRRCAGPVLEDEFARVFA